MKAIGIFLFLTCVPACFGQGLRKTYENAFFRVNDYILQPYDPDSLLAVHLLDYGDWQDTTFFLHPQLYSWKDFTDASPQLYLRTALLKHTTAGDLIDSYNTEKIISVNKEMMKNAFQLTPFTNATLPVESLKDVPPGNYLLTYIYDIRHEATKRQPAYFGFEDPDKHFLYRGVPNRLEPLWPDTINNYTFTGSGCELSFDERTLVVVPGESRLCNITVINPLGEEVYNRDFRTIDLSSPHLYLITFDVSDLSQREPGNFYFGLSDWALFAKPGSYTEPYLESTIQAVNYSLNGEQYRSSQAIPEERIREIFKKKRSVLTFTSVIFEMPDGTIREERLDRTLYLKPQKDSIRYSFNEKEL